MTDERKNTDIESDVTGDDTDMTETEFEDVGGIGDAREDAVPVAAPPTPPD